jgi:anti-anti-sigma factor
MKAVGTLIKVFVGEYDLTHKARLQEEFSPEHTEARNLILDMSAVTYLDSTFVRELLRLEATRAARGFERMTIVQVTPAVKRVFAVLGLRTLLRIVDSPEEALPNNGKRIVVQQACRGDRASLQHSAALR